MPIYDQGRARASASPPVGAGVLPDSGSAAGARPAERDGPESRLAPGLPTIETGGQPFEAADLAAVLATCPPAAAWRPVAVESERSPMA